uniref:Protein-PII uridylyltransferase N-terminal domain-containing protein n=1 Tax=Branchiostoma floridae TaxID=7739 RepID=C3YI25_BRAFL|eukprot:XP_002604151.1 hypothetical protein BRAFLDRAFT_71557 [Branchiostoma floridae]
MTSLADKLQDLELCLKSQHEQEVSYGQALREAIVCMDLLIEVEVLKCLGDLHLQNAKLIRDSVEFDKAAALYAAALLRCKDPDMGQTLEHRIGYMEKLSRQLLQGYTPHFRWLLPDYWGTADSNALRVAEIFNTLDRSNKKSQRSTEETYTETIVTAIENSDMFLEVEVLKSLGDLYLEKGKKTSDVSQFSKAAAMYKKALARCEDPETKPTLDHRISYTEKITKAVEMHVLSIEQTEHIDDTEKHKLMLNEDRHHAEREIKRIDEEIDPYSLDEDDPELREVEKKRVEAIKILFETIVQQRKTFITRLVDECIDVMGPPPCKYAMIGLGSQATGLVTPYSDLEFAILIEVETDHNANYFRNLTHYLHLKVINLGETILPAMGIKSLNNFFSGDPLDNWYYDSVTPRGFSFDGAMPHACKTPLGRGSNSTGTSELIHTPSNMTKVLKDDLKFHLKKGYHLASILGNVSLITGEQDLVNEHMSLWTQQLQVNKGTIPLVMANTILNENMQTFQIQDLTASLLNVKKEMYRFSSLAVTCWALLHNIQPTTIWGTIQELKNGRVVNAENAHHLMVMVSISAELRLRTYMNNHGQVENMSALSSISRDTDIGAKLKKVFYFSNRQQLMRYYYTARPLKKVISQLSNSQSQNNRSVLFDNSSELKAEVYESLCDYQSSAMCNEETLQNKTSTSGENTPHIDVVNALFALGYTRVKLGDQRKAVGYYEQSLQMVRHMYGEDTAHPDIASSLNNLGFAWSHLGDHRKAVSYHEQSLQMMQIIYGDNTAHPDIASSLNNLGVAWSHLGDHKKAISYYEQSLKMKQIIYDDNTTHRDIANSLHNLGVSWSHLGDHRKAISYHEQSLQMYQSIYVTCWALLHNIQPTTIWGTIQELKNGRVVNAENAHHLMVMVSISAELRLRTYMNNHGQVENMSALSSISRDTDIGAKLKKVFYFSNRQQLMRYYYTARPLKKVISQLSNSQSQNNRSVLFDNSSELKAEVYESLCDYQSSAMCNEETLQNKTSTSGENTPHIDVVNALFALGYTRVKLGDQRKAVGYYEQSLQMVRHMYGEDTAHPDIASSLNNLGCAWSHLGDHRKAVSYHEQSLQMKQIIYGEDTAHPDIANSLNNLGIAWSDLGDHRKAISYYEQSLQMKRIIYGEDTAHPDIADSLNNLGVARSNLGDHRKAISYYEQSLQMKQIIYGEDTAHPDITDSLYNLGTAWSDLGDHRKAISYCEQSLQMMRIIYDEADYLCEDTAHPDITDSLYNLGNAWSDLGDHRKAISYCEQSLKMMRIIYGKDTAHLDIASLLNNLGVARSNLGDHRKAISYYEQSLQMKQIIYVATDENGLYGEDTAHPNITKSLRNLGTVWRNLGDPRKAISYYEQSLQMEQIIYGDNTAHPDIPNSLNNLGNAWSQLGDHRKAINYFEQSLQMMQSIYGESTAHPNITKSLRNLGTVWRNLGDPRKAISYYEQSLQMEQIIYGDNTAHPDIPNSLNNLGNAWSQLGDHRKAINYYEQSLRMRQRVYGKNTAHPDIAKSLYNLGTAWSHLGDHRKAISYNEQSLQMRQTIYALAFSWPQTDQSRRPSSVRYSSCQ